MTHNQVAYFQARNDEAKNLETARHNKKQEDLSTEQINVTKEYNYLQAANAAQQLAEQARHNRAYEALQYAQIEAQRAYNEAQVRLANANLLLSQRDVSVREGQLQVSQRKNEIEADKAAKQLEETIRHNRATESETKKQNTWTNLLSIGKTVVGFTQAIATSLLTREVVNRKLLAQ